MTPELLGREILLVGRLWLLVSQRHNSPESAQPVHTWPRCSKHTKTGLSQGSYNVAVCAHQSVCKHCKYIKPFSIKCLMSLWQFTCLTNSRYLDWVFRITSGMMIKLLKLLGMLRRSSGSDIRLCGVPLFFSSTMLSPQPACACTCTRTHTHDRVQWAAIRFQWRAINATVVYYLSVSEWNKLAEPLLRV